MRAGSAREWKVIRSRYCREQGSSHCWPVCGVLQSSSRCKRETHDAFLVHGIVFKYDVLGAQRGDESEPFGIAEIHWFDEVYGGSQLLSGVVLPHGQ